MEPVDAGKRVTRRDIETLCPALHGDMKFTEPAPSVSTALRHPAAGIAQRKSLRRSIENNEGTLSIVYATSRVRRLYEHHIA
jgi:hypothetical protein